GKGDKYECTSYRGISLLSVVGKVYGRVLIRRVREGTEGVIGDEQCGFRRGRGCTDQIFAVRQVCEKYLAKGKEVFWAFMDLEKAYDRIDREALWTVLRMYGIGGRLLKE
uniref:RNA-directed DNA polymerase n=1 Tax=Klebsiella pneumoniae TaxID=573 RepID=UPI003EB93A31